MLGPSKPLNNSETGIQFKKDSWCLDSDASSPLAVFGSVSVNYHPTTRKIVVQGSAYLDFATLAIPKIVENMKTEKMPTTAATAIEEVVNTTNNISNREDGSSALIEGFRRIENAVVELRTDLIRKVDQTAVNIMENKENKNLEDICKKLDKLDSLLVENKTEMASINEKLAVLADRNLVNLDPTSVQAVAAAVSDISGTKERELERIADTMNEVKEKLVDKNLDEVVHTSRQVLEQMKTVKDLSDTFSSGLDKLDTLFENNILKEVAMNSEKSVSALNSLNNNMEKFLAKLDVKNSNVDVMKEPVVITTEEVKNAPEDNKKRRGKLFSSSVALGCNKEKLELELNCDLEIVATYHINENASAPDPEKYLENMITTHVKPGDVDFIIISVGSNDVTFLDNEKSEVLLNQEAIEQSSVLAELAYQAGEKHGIEVFVTVRPARYDRKDKDPKSLRSKLTQSANGMQVALISVLERVHNIHLPALENLTDKTRKELFKNDGIHLTKAGLGALEDNLIQGIKSVYTDIKDIDNNDDSRIQHELGTGRSEPAGHRPAGHGPARHGPGGQGGYKPRSRERHTGDSGRPGAGGGYVRRPYTDQPRQHNRDWRGNTDRQMHNMQNMMRDFMMFMDNGSGGFRGRNRY